MAVAAKGFVATVMLGLLCVGVFVWTQQITEHAYDGAQAANQRAATETAVAPTRVLPVPTVGFRQMTGADWIALSRSDQDSYARQALALFRCPSSVTANDVSLLVSQAAGTPDGERQKVSDILAATLTVEACVPTR